MDKPSQALEILQKIQSGDGLVKAEHTLSNCCVEPILKKYVVTCNMAATEFISGNLDGGKLLLDSVLNSLGITNNTSKEYPSFLINLYIYYYAKKGDTKTACELLKRRRILSTATNSKGSLFSIVS